MAILVKVTYLEEEKRFYKSLTSVMCNLVWSFAMVTLVDQLLTAVAMYLY